MPDDYTPVVYGLCARRFPMRCEECGRPMKNAELWRLATDPQAPTSRSMRYMCWDCRKQSSSATSDTPATSASHHIAPVVAEAAEVVERYEASLDG